MAEDLAQSTAAAEAPRDAGATEPLLRRPPEGRVAYRARFALAYLALAAVAGGAVGAAVVLFDRPATDDAQWSQWQPQGPETQYATEIAERVSGRYRDAQNRKLVNAFAGPPEIQGEQLLGVAIEADTGRSEDASFNPLGKGVIFQLCGGGQICSFADGNLDLPRLRLLRQESLELALYSFKYVDDLDSVVTLLPPDPDESTADEGDGTTIALFFRRGDLQPQLERPLTATLPQANAPRVGRLDAREALVVDRLTRDHIFTYDFTRVQTGSPILLLRPLSQALQR